MNGTMAADRPTGRRGLVVLLGFALLLALIFFAVFVFRYVSITEEVFGRFWPHRGWLLVHITGGTVALLLGPFQIWLGITGRKLPLHRVLGISYMATVAVSCVAAFNLAVTTQFGWVFGLGLGLLAVAWIITTGLAYIAIRRRRIPQHREWMIRSYVVTFAFVNFRIIIGIFQVAGVGVIQEQLMVASWACWAVPLLITEAILQGRKILSPRSAMP